MQSWRSAIVLCCACATLALSFCLPVHAEGEKSESGRLIVALPEASTGLPAEELVLALRAQLSELGVRVVLSARPFEGTEEVSDPDGDDGASALAFVWLGREGEDLSVHFFESAGATLRQRRLPLRGTDAASLEEVAIVVRSAVSALLDREDAEEVPAEPVEPALEAESPVVTPPRSAPRKSEPTSVTPLWLSLGYAGSSYAPGLPFSQGVGFSLGVRPTQGIWSLGLGYSFVFVQKLEREELTLEITRHPLEAFVRVDSSQAQGPLYIGGQAGAVVDWVRRRTTSASDEFEVAPAVTRSSWALSGRAILGAELGSRVSLEMQGGADVVLNRVATEVENGPNLVVPYRFRPRVLAQFLWNFP